MICTTIRKDEECVFMTKAGCSYKDGACMPIVEQCEGCGKVGTYETGQYCSASPDPASKWKIGNCNLATHIKAEAAAAKQKINPLKASKRANK